jgi:phosphate-selective porin OprO/OprP
MSLRHKSVILVSAAVIVLPSTALAQAKPMTIEEATRRIADMQAQIADMQAQLQAMQEAQGAQAARTEALAARTDAQDAKLAVADKAASDEVKISWKGAPEIAGKGWSFKVRGRAMFDAAYVSTPDGIGDTGLGFSNELRRGRLGVQGKVPGNIGYKMEIDFASGEAEFTDAYLDLGVGKATLVIGQHNNFQSLEELSSSLHTSFIERAAFTDAFNFERRVGASLAYAGDGFLVQAGVFTDNISDLSSDENNSYSLDGRAVFNPKLGNAQLHFGGSIHHREIQDSAASTRYRQRPAVHTTDTRFIATPNLPVEAETSYGLEAAIISGPWYAAAEGHWLKADLATAGAASPTFFGGYVEGGFFLTGETRGYKDGQFDRVKVKNPLSKGGPGAFSINLRYDRLDLVDAGIVGGSQNGLQASLNWKPSDYVLFGLNYARLDYDDAAVAQVGGDRDYVVDMIALRSQFDF